MHYHEKKNSRVHRSPLEVETHDLLQTSRLFWTPEVPGQDSNKHTKSREALLTKYNDLQFCECASNLNLYQLILLEYPIGVCERKVSSIAVEFSDCLIFF